MNPRYGWLRSMAVGAASVMALGAVSGPALAAAGHVNTPAEANAIGMRIANSVKLDKALAAELPAALRKSGVLVIGAQLQQPPDDYYAPNGKTPIGFEVDIAQALGNELGLKIRYLPMAFDALIPSLQDGRVDMTMSAMNDTLPREKAVNFVDYLVDGIGILVQKGNPHHISTPMNLCGLSVTAVSGTTQQAYANQLSSECKASGKKPVTLVLSSSTAQEEESLITGRVAAILNDVITDAYDVQTQPSLYQAVNYPPINPGPYGIGINKKDPKLLKAVQAALQRLMNNGVFRKILIAWGVASTALSKATINHGIPG
jgi:polar amino acid transport system substrate-binding protein